MTTRCTRLCDFCYAEMPEANSKKIKDTGAMVIQIGYSNGGWGNRQNLFLGIYDDICADCYRHLMNVAGKFVEMVQELRKKR